MFFFYLNFYFKFLIINDLEWDSEDKVSVRRNYARARNVIVLHYLPCPCAFDRCCCPFNRCCRTGIWCLVRNYTCSKRIPCCLRTWNKCYRWKKRQKEIEAGDKLTQSWKKEECIEGKVTLALIYTEMLERREYFTLRYRKSWLKKYFFPEGKVWQSLGWFCWDCCFCFLVFLFFSFLVFFLFFFLPTRN